MTQWQQAKDLVESAWIAASKDADFRFDQSLRATLDEVFQQLDQGVWRVAEPEKNRWTVHPWIKKAILLFFRMASAKAEEGVRQVFFDKIPLKTRHWTQETFEAQKFRMVTGAVVRRSAYIGPGSVIMPCFINVGAYIGEATVIDSMSSIGSCAQIGNQCHISEGVCLGGMLEPLAAHPVTVEDHCFIGARCSLDEGVVVERGSVLGPGIHLAASTQIYHVVTGAFSQGRIPPYSVVINGTWPDARGFGVPTAILIKTIDPQRRAQASIAELLREESLSAPTSSPPFLDLPPGKDPSS